MGDLPLTQRNRQTDRIAERDSRRLRTRPLAAATGRGLKLFEPCSPNNLATHPHPSVNLCKGRALAGSGQPEPVDAPRLDGVTACPKQSLVDHSANRRARRTANRGH